MDDAESIKENGLGQGAEYGITPPSIHLTNDHELAEFYANRHKNPAIVTVRANPRNLQVDWNSFEDPVHTDTPHDFDESKLRGDTSADWKNSLRQTGAVLHYGAIPASNILNIKKP